MERLQVIGGFFFRAKGQARRAGSSFNRIAPSMGRPASAVCQPYAASAITVATMRRDDEAYGTEASIAIGTSGLYQSVE